MHCKRFVKNIVRKSNANSRILRSVVVVILKKGDETTRQNKSQNTIIQVVKHISFEAIIY